MQEKLQVELLNHDESEHKKTDTLNMNLIYISCSIFNLKSPLPRCPILRAILRFRPFNGLHNLETTKLDK